VPPLACKELEYGKPTVPGGTDEELMVNGEAMTGAAATDRANVAVADCAGELVSVAVIPME
jgi:hypothetical protein